MSVCSFHAEPAGRFFVAPKVKVCLVGVLNGGRKERKDQQHHGQMFEHVPRNEILGENLTFP